MPLPKESYFVGNSASKKIISFVVLIAGIVGALIVLFGFTQTTPQIYYASGACLLLLTAIYYKLTYFIALELILLAEHGADLLGIGPILQVVLPILLSLQMLVYYLLSGQLNNIFRLIGVVGIALLSIGFSFQNNWIFLFGSLAVGIYALDNVYRGKYIALLWAILNLFFVFAMALVIIF
ncbi:hypothetical protein [Legionella oakridgensis]|uniref:Uncharacterized protein n=2 Tax=Legionella oakridgensis TaxID=29423 RepID=W0BB32_9GAMM|nr:hypothetical protein [Legionella oakridgensis]AHE67070.1 hypothetical protein Loa_01521 [Legionella oakridgensis ATCC 33761 = DSM 21215]ETO93252.1 hypothetical protein LOR_71c19960 [Legionella oakridgensis RV-2-2007]KTD44468.1 hypothetical protein Loak_0168 [Legionella oakridgensis]STY20163.1 Uncharacterised protein [Legionella longbeachae]